MNAQPNESPPQTRLIKRYANRKLYDTHESRYITLQQVAALLREGADIRIIDNASKEDLTNVTLAQIIYEEEKRSDSEARRRTLRSFIIEGRERLKDGRERLFDSLPSTLTKLVRGDDDEGTETRERLVIPSLEELKNLADDRLRSFLHSALGHVSALQGEVTRLQRQVEELEERLTRMARRRETNAEASGSDSFNGDSTCGDGATDDPPAGLKDETVESVSESSHAAPPVES